MKKILILLSSIVILCGCQEIDCTKQIYMGYEYLYDYEFEYPHNEAYLDSVVSIINIVKTKCPKMHYEVQLLKAEMYIKKREWKNAISEIEKIDISELPNKKVFISRLRIKDALERGDSSTTTLYPEYKAIIAYYEHYINDNKHSVTKKVKNKDAYEIEHYSRIDDMFMELFYYKLQMEDTLVVFNDIDSIQKAMDGNPIYFDMIKYRLEQGKDIPFSME